jgi:peptidoglycan/xylan/chitin deacetylase (PgdA/CDA1 family)
VKIIISHDVDHLYSADHWKHDLIIPKLWVRSFLHLCQRKIDINVFLRRIKYGFEKEWNHTREVLELDKSYGIPSTFFIGMSRGLGMSYSVKSAERVIHYIKGQGFDIGVHGVEYADYEKMAQEYKRFKTIVGDYLFGMRMHYVRKDETTLRKLDDLGYVFDSTEFDKKGKKIKAPYKVNGMWEIPLHIMDGYVIEVGDSRAGKKNTIRLLKKVEEQGVPFCTILFHDYYYNASCYPQEKQWYDWLLQYIKKQGYEYISFKDAIKELED